MVFVIVTHVPHIIEDSQYFAYSPYVREINIWLKNFDKVIIVAPIENTKKTPIHIHYEHANIEFVAIDSFDLLSVKSIFKSLFVMPLILFKIGTSFNKADHIHLRCPGNVGLLGVLVQIIFPSKSKTAKYAGNWDPKAKNPLSYRLQKYILSHTFLTRNMQVLVYGEWKNSSKNIKPFFTATYKESDKKEILPKTLDTIIKMVFVGTLSAGKRPLYAIGLVEKLMQKGFKIELSVFGEGNERKNIEEYIVNNKLQNSVILYGNKDISIIQKAYQDSHFVLLPSQSEGWPKAIAEGMFWSCVPIATRISCVPNMLDEGNRGLLLQVNLEKDVQAIQQLINNEELYRKMVVNGVQWSRKYTLDYFEQEIKLLLQP